ncbi:MAG TPA: alpha/beta hydrolase [Gemmatimonadaceae bacterium]|nr:alpha/beta hydrolase [Gemmatimonadaceae bacterium]
MARRSGRSVGKILLGLVAAAVAVGVIYEQVGVRNDARRLPRIGRAVDIGGRSLNIYCSGEGAPAVIFDAGAGTSGYAWWDIQREMAKETRACWFDRAGFGWSDIGPFPRTSAAASRDLHELLHRDSITMPFIYVGHSLGGLNARIYNAMYPTEIAGVIFVDAAHEDEPRRAPAFMLGRSAPRALWHPIWIAAHTARLVGLIRLTTPSPSLPADPTQRTREQVLNALRSQPKTIASLSDASGPESYREAESAGGFGDRPVVVLTRGRVPQSPPTSEMDKEGLAYEQVWMHEIQPKLARLSTHGRQVIVPNSGHDIPREAPEAVIAAVRDVLRAARQSRR